MNRLVNSLPDSHRGVTNPSLRAVTLAGLPSFLNRGLARSFCQCFALSSSLLTRIKTVEGFASLLQLSTLITSLVMSVCSARAELKELYRRGMCTQQLGFIPPVQNSRRQDFTSPVVSAPPLLAQSNRQLQYMIKDE